jgi:hypothetical protein
MHTVLLAAKVLSAVALFALVAALVNLWRRPSIPAFSYGAVTLSQRRLKAVWFAFLLGALAVGSNNDPVLRYTEGTEGPASTSTDNTSNTTYSVNIPLPFYRYERTARWVNGTMVDEHILEGLVLPWSFLWALLAYYILVVRWNPDSRWARRILEGRKAPEP